MTTRQYPSSGIHPPASFDLPLRFIADDMLGRLAKWLRILGYDAAYPAPADDAELLHRAHAERRILLTRDRALAARPANVPIVLIVSPHLQEQLAQLVRELHLEIGDKVLSRCLVCNHEIESISKEDAAGHVPDFIYRTHHTFHRCPLCGRIYWHGTHVERMLRAVSQING